MSQIIITIVFDTEVRDAKVNVITLGPDKSVSVKDLLMALNIVQGQYIAALGIEPERAQQEEDDADKD